MHISPIVAFAPILNAGVRNLCDFSFSNDIQLSRTNIPTPLQDAIRETHCNDWISSTEATHIDASGGILWTVLPSSGNSVDDVIKVSRQASSKLMNALWCIYCHKFGENTYWRNGNLIAHCAVYLKTPIGGLFNAPHRFPFMFGVPNGEGGTMCGWTKEHLASAGQLLSAIESFQKRVPRVHLAGQLQRLMASIDTRTSVPARLQLAVTAMETLYIAPSERKYIWDSKVQDRIARICKNLLLETPTYFDDLNEVRNDVVHRGGLDGGSQSTDMDPRLKTVLITTELILRDSIKWAIINLPEIDKRFERDEWPAI